MAGLGYLAGNDLLLLESGAAWARTVQSRNPPEEEERLETSAAG